MALFPRFQRVLPEEREVDSKCTRNANGVLASMIVRAKLPFLSQMRRGKNSKFLTRYVWCGLFLLSETADVAFGGKKIEEMPVNKKPDGTCKQNEPFFVTVAEDDSST